MVLEVLSVVVEKLEIRLLILRDAEIAEPLKVVGQGVPQGLSQNFQSALHAKLRQPLIATECIRKVSRCPASAIQFLSSI